MDEERKKRRNEEKNELAKVIGEKIGNFIHDKGMVQQTVADAIDVDQTTISIFISGKRPPTALQLVALSQTFGCTVDELLGLEEKRKKDIEEKPFVFSPHDVCEMIFELYKEGYIKIGKESLERVEDRYCGKDYPAEVTQKYNCIYFPIREDFPKSVTGLPQDRARTAAPFDTEKSTNKLERFRLRNTNAIPENIQINKFISDLLPILDCNVEDYLIEAMVRSLIERVSETKKTPRTVI